MSLTTEQLMQPRWEVIADYPGSAFKVGQILLKKLGRLNPDKYPGIFQRLAWWEFRTKNDMPEYLRIISEINGSDNRGHVFKAIPGAYNKHIAEGYSEDGKGFDNILIYCFSPATEEEYNTYQAQKK